MAGCSSCLLKSWSTTQPVIALSSGEAELYALVKTAQAKGLFGLLLDYYLVTTVTVHTTLTATIGIVHRNGLGKTKHIETQHLWIQECVGDKSIAVRKVVTKENPAYIVTEGLKREPSMDHIRNVGGTVQAPKPVQHRVLVPPSSVIHEKVEDGRPEIRGHDKSFLTKMPLRR